MYFCVTHSISRFCEINKDILPLFRILQLDFNSCAFAGVTIEENKEYNIVQ